MEERNGLAWLGRKIGWGLADGQLDEWTRLGTKAVIDRLVDPDGFKIPARPDPFSDIDRDNDKQAQMLALGTMSWIDDAVVSPRPLETFMEFFWSDYFAVSARVVRPRHWLFDHMNLLAVHCTGNFAELLRAVTIDPSMLFFLDGGRNTADNPNENYGRELLELYSVGVGNFTEDDVKAAARALTGWRARRRDANVTIRSRSHDDSPQTLLGVDGVHDLDTTMAAVLAHPATARRVVNKMATAVLGAGYDMDLVTDLAASFAQDWELKPVLRHLLELGVAGRSVPSILEPVAWYVTARKLPLAQARRPQLREFFALSGQLLLHPPNVGGFPPPDAYLSTSATVARFNLASHLAEQSMSNASRIDPVDMTRDIGALAERLGFPDGFRPETRDALSTLQPGIDRLAASLASADLVVV
ncbi:MAG: DUF1800 family protein [Acidimicrobiales bacterium]